MTVSDHDIAIVGMACRFPAGISSPNQFWEFLRAKGDAITEVPADRWSVSAFYHPDPARPGKTYARHGGFLRDVMRFDAEFFGMSPREAARADPQQRLLLEVAWEALEDAGLRTDELSGAAVGTYVGISSFDYAGMQWAMRRDITAHTSVGSALSIAANRLAYQFDLRGPSLAVDTACSSSLVACHLACESLRRGETEMALKA